jgi:DNA-binding winged helix-turn-helix (wHTH) protein/Tol biopolymer transport system component
MASPMPVPATIRFDAFELDAKSGELRKSGILLRLQPQPFRLLSLLIDHAGQVVTREQIQRSLWADSTFVDFDHGINYSINQIRSALADNPEKPRYIETLPKRGYRFIGNLEQPPIPRPPEMPIPERMGNVTALEPASDSRPETTAPHHWHRVASLAVVANVAKKRKFELATGILVMLVLFAAVSLGIRSLLRNGHAIPFQDFTITQLTRNGKTGVAAISPDGKYLASVVDDNGKSSLWLRHIETNSDTQLIPPAAAASYGTLQFLPDGSYIYFVNGDKNDIGAYDISRVPVLGGAPQTLVRDIDSAPAFSPGGERIAFVRANNPEINMYRLIVANPDGTEERVIRSGPVSRQPVAVVWSPDGKQILGFGLFNQSVTAGSPVVSFDVASGQERSLAAFDELFEDVAPTPDKQGFLVLYRSKASNFRSTQIGFVSLSASKLWPITRDTNNYGWGMTVSGDRKTLVTVQEKSNSGLYLLPTTTYDANPPRQVLAQQNDISDFAWASNTELYVASGSGLFRASTDGSGNLPLIIDPHAAIFHIAGSAPGRFAAFDWVEIGKSHNAQNLWRVDADGSSRKQIIKGSYDARLVCSPDGKWLYYAEPGSSGVFRVSVEGGARQSVAGTVLPGFTNTFGGVDVSFDGKLLAFNVWGALPSKHTNVDENVIVSLDSGAEPSLRMIEADQGIDSTARFTPDGKALVHAIQENGIYKLWLQPLDGSPGRQITSLASGRILQIQFSPDGQYLGVLRTTHTESDVVLLHDIGTAR